MKKHFVVMDFGQVTIYPTLEQAKESLKGKPIAEKTIQEAWDDESVLKLIECAKDFHHEHSNFAKNELIEMADLYNSHNLMPYSNMSRLALAQYHKSTKWCFVKTAAFKVAYINMQRILKDDSARLKRYDEQIRSRKAN